MKPLRIYLSVICIVLISSCGKLIENKERSILLEIMTTGQWHVESYKQGTIEITAEFEGYNFKFNENGSVIGIKGADSITGNWIEDIQNYSISSNFPQAIDPLKKLNGTWKIKDSGLDFVAAEMKIDQEIMILRLRKTP